MELNQNHYRKLRLMREREREGGRDKDQSNEGNESVSSAETVEDAVLPLGGFVDLVPPIGDRHGR